MHSKRGRKEQGKFIAEGIRLLEESLRHKIFPEKIIYSESMINERSRALLLECHRLKIPLEPAKARDMEAISETRSSQGLLGLFPIPRYDIDRTMKLGNNYLLLDKISDPGNTGTLIRSARAFGFAGIFLTDDSIDPYNSKVIRATAGAIFGLPIIDLTFDELSRIKKRFEIILIIGDIKGGNGDAILKKWSGARILLLGIGSEATGFSKEIQRLTDDRIRIRHEKAVESLNAAVAGSILMKEIYARRSRP